MFSKINVYRCFLYTNSTVPFNYNRMWFWDFNWRRILHQSLETLIYKKVVSAEVTDGMVSKGCVKFHSMLILHWGCIYQAKDVTKIHVGLKFWWQIGYGYSRLQNRNRYVIIRTLLKMCDSPSNIYHCFLQWFSF